jgi:hypothetical protein
MNCAPHCSNPPYISITRQVAQSKFKACCACGSVKSDDIYLQITRAGKTDWALRYPALEIDADNNVVIAWDEDIHCLKPGWYYADLFVGCQPCGRFPLKLGAQCDGIFLESTPYAPNCDINDTCVNGCKSGVLDPLCGLCNGQHKPQYSRPTYLDEMDCQ